MTAPADPAKTDTLTLALQAHFGFDAFHKGQQAVIEDVLAGRQTVAVMPTGAGKSLCYQLPALLLDGVTVVVSPLIALMKDQVDALRARGIAADLVNSSQSREDQRAALDRLGNGESRLVYVAPERFRSGSFRRALEQVPLALFAIDEAHCISRWGHDFRPDYVRLGEAVRHLQPPRLLACTATATTDVREDMTQVLGMTDPAVHIAGFLRSNLFLEARLCSGDRDREQRLARFLREGKGQDGSVIVYASTRKRVERYALACSQALGHGDVVHYHGGLEDAEREVAQQRFMSGEARVAVATNAFGMGVDRADVRAVVHVDLPRTVEGYYQQVGRAGRDGEPAHCLLLYNTVDTRVHHFLIDMSHPPPEMVAATWSALQGLPEGGSATPRMLAGRAPELDGEERLVDAAIRILDRVDAVRFDGRGGYAANTMAPTDPADLGIDFGQIQRHRAHELSMLAAMKRFVHHAGCRHAYVLDYFGEAMDPACPGCDRCHPTGEGAVPGLLYEDPPEDEALVLRKTLSGVARAEGRFGLRKVAGMLAGSKARELTRTSLVDLSTYGLLSTLGADRCAELLQLLVNHELCRLSGGDYPLIRITDGGWAVMRGERSAGFRPPPHLLPGSTTARRAEMLRRPASVHAEPLTGAEACAADTLRDWRRTEATRRGVPPYVVFHDRTLQALAASLPTDRASFLAIPGLGPGKWESFGEALLVVAATLEDQGPR